MLVHKNEAYKVTSAYMVEILIISFHDRNLPDLVRNLTVQTAVFLLEMTPSSLQVTVLLLESGTLVRQI